MSVTAPLGFRAAGVAAGIKTSGSFDVAVVINDGPSAAAAGVFTSNRVKAAPVRWSQQVLASGQVHAVVLNSGGANACTGPDGYADTRQTAEHLAGPRSRPGRPGAGGARRVSGGPPALGRRPRGGGAPPAAPSAPGAARAARRTRCPHYGESSPAL